MAQFADATNIIGSIRPVQVKSPFELQNEANQIALGGIQRENAFAQMESNRRAMADEQALREVYERNKGDLAKTRDELYGRGLYKQAGSLDETLNSRKKSQIEMDGKQFELAQKKIDLMGQTFGFVKDNPTVENAKRGLDNLLQAGALTPEQHQQAVSSIPQDPTQIQALATQYFQQALDAKDQLGKIETRDAGGRVETIQTNPVTGQVRSLNSIDKTLSPDQVVDNQRMQAQLDEQRRHNLTTEGLQGQQVGLQGQRLAFDKSGGATAVNAVKPTKPLPASALKLQQEELDAIGSASSINADLGAIGKQIKDGKLELGPMSNIVSRGQNALGISTESSRNYQTFLATLEKLRNDSLRLNKGVQTDGDAQRAWNELLTNINDPKVVQQRLEEIQKINNRAINLRKMNIDNIRMNYGKDPLDTTGYESQAPAVGGANAGMPSMNAIQAELARRKGKK